MDASTAGVTRLGAELGSQPADDLLPNPAGFLARVAVERADEDQPADPDVRAAVAALHRLLGRTARPWCGPALEAALAGLDPVWAPAQAVRLAAALGAGLMAGHLPAGMPWAVHVEDPVGAAGPALGPVLDLVADLLDAWDPTLAPPVVTTNVGTRRRAGASYRPAPDRLTTVPDLWIDLDPWTAADAPLPGPRDAPSVVVRPAPGAATDPGPPPPPALPVPRQALDAVARWCFPPGDGQGAPDRRTAAAHLFTGPWPPPDGPWWRREVADLLLAAQPDQPGAWCRRARVEAEHPAGSRARHARLVEAAARRGAAGDLRRHAAGLRRGRRSAWALDVWDVADAGLEAMLAADVMEAAAVCHPAELALALAARVEAAAARSRALVLPLLGLPPSGSAGPRSPFRAAGTGQTAG